MAGHSKWANIQHRKGRQDAKRGKLFTKLSREVTVAAKLGGEDPASNPRLRAAIDNALSNNMTKDSIERAIKRGSKDEKNENLDEVRYEGYGPSSVAIMVDAITDNKNRTAAEIRHAFSKFGGNLASGGSVNYLFKKIGLISLPPGLEEDAIMEIALENGADDVVSNDDGSFDVITPPNDFLTVKNALLSAGIELSYADVITHAPIEKELDMEKGESVLKLLNTLEELDDVQKVHSNAKIPDAVLD